MNTVLGIVTQDNKVLLGKVRQDKVEEYGGLMYAFPSGQPINDETAEENITREIKEQTGYVIEVFSKIGERQHPTTNNWTEYYHCRIISQQAFQKTHNSDLEELIWVHPKEISNYMPSLFQAVKDYLENI